jgi:glycerol kinase
VSPELEATTLGAAYLAGLATGVWKDEADIAARWSPKAVVEPTSTPDRDRWRAARDRAAAWVPELSALDF